jgi:hypothetical protein
MIKHIGTSAIMDLLLRMLTCIEPQQLRQDVLNVSVGVFLVLKFLSIFLMINHHQPVTYSSTVAERGEGDPEAC